MNRPLFFSGLSLFLAILFCEITDALFPTTVYTVAGIVILISLVCSIIFLCLFLSKRKGLFLTLVLISFFFALGCLLRQATDIRMTAVKHAYIGQTVTTSFTVEEEPYISGYRRKCIAKSTDFPYKVFLYLPEGYSAKTGDIIEGSFKIEAPPDGNRYFIDGIIMEANTVEIFSHGSPKIRPLQYYGEKITAYAEAILGKLFGGYSAFVESILLGGSGRLSDTRWLDLKGSGLLHITCVSGLHISIFISSVALAFSKLKRPKLSFALTAVCVFTVLVVCSFSPSSVRASMTGLTMLAYDKKVSRPDGLNLLGLPMIILLCSNPFYAIDVSFLLSFSAVTGIHLFNKRVHSSLITRITAETGKLPSKPMKWLVQALSLSIVCTVSTMPVSIIFFDSAVTASVLSGVICLWAVTPIYVCSLICLLLAPLPFADFLVQPLAFTVKKGVSYIMSIAEILSDLETSVFDLSQIDLSDFSLKGLDTNFAMWFAIFIVAVFIALLFRPFKDKKAKVGKPGKAWILLLVAVILVGAYFIQNAQSDGVVDPDSVTVGFVDVGQGSCSVVIKDDFTAIIDCGGTTEPGKEAVRFIQRYGDGEIDVMIISHLHADHVNGITDILSSVEVEKIYVPYTAGDEIYEDELFTAAATYGVYVEQLEEDMTISENGIELQLYTQHLDPDNDQNDNSIVTKAVYDNFSVLFTGDIGKKAEKVIIDIYPDLTAEVLAVPHHGSSSSSTAAFLATVQPNLSIISVSEDTSYGHPTPAAIERLEVYGDILCTKDCGNIRIISDGYDYEIFTDNEIN